MNKKPAFTCVLLFSAVLVLPRFALSQSDPGVRPGPINGQPNASQSSPMPLSSVGANSPAGILEFFDNGLGRFQQQEVVSGGVNNGLGPRFNLNSCSGCHAQPAVGGSSPSSNPQYHAIGQGVVAGSTNSMPSFITPHGPVREARFPFFTNANGSPNQNSPNGGVEDLFTVTGRSDAGNCNLSQPNFEQAQQNDNIIFRIPTPVFGAGLIENIDDSTLMANQRAQAANNFGIAGTFNRNGNDGTIARFGWKAQNKSLLLFAGEAYNVEMGITNEIFVQERPLPQEEQGSGLPANCMNLSGLGYPEDATNFRVAFSSDQAAQNAQVPSDIVVFAEFMRLLAPPTPSMNSPGGQQSIAAGFGLFRSIGCASCHTPSLRSTQPSSITASLSHATANAFSDFEIHHMGGGLADNVAQGGAGGDQFRTAPLWGLGQRIFFLHDGRTNDLLVTIAAHSSNGSEATQVIENFNSLSSGQQQQLLNFLRSL
ncbi:MAG TPA: di-heme oxidoredictase family protein [Steroidobacteraceae bacterium]|jgi:CxxC motif-containing protein (DUF1111 family)